MATARLEELRSKFEENPRRFFAPFANELRKSGDAAQAIAICRTHLAGQPGHVSGHIVLAQALHDAGALEEASREFQAALDVDPENMIALRAVGDICAAQGDFDGARSWYVRVLDVDPRNEEMRELLRTLPEPAVAEDPASDDSAAELSGVAPDLTEDVMPEAALTGALDFLPPEARADAASEVAPPSLATETFARSLEDAGETVEEIELSESFFSEPFEAAASGPSVEPTPQTASIEVGSLDATPPRIEGGALDSSADTLEMEMPEAATVSASDAGDLDFDLGASEGTLSTDAVDTDATVDLPNEWFTPATPAPAAEPDMSSADWSLPDPRTSAALAPEMPEESVAEPAPREDETQWRPKPTPAAVHSDFEAAPDDWFSSAGEATLEREAEALSNTEIESIAAPRDDMASWFPVAADDATPAPEADATPDSAPVSGPSSPSDDAAVPVPEISGSLGFAESETDGAGTDDPASASAEPETVAEPETAVESKTAAEPERATEPLRDRATPAVSAAFPEGSTSPFVTETLAELYVQQGFREEALSIYRQLILARPADAALRQRAEEVEGMLSGAASSGRDAEASAGGIPAPSAAGMSVRGFFSRLATRKPGTARALTANGTSGPAGPGASAVASGIRASSGHEADAIDSEALTMPALSEGRDAALSPDPAVRSAIARQTPSALAALFPASSPSDSDLAAATSLASAFSEPPSEGRPSGRPAKAVDRELSLDHLFRDIARPAAPGMSLDSFFESAGRGNTSVDATQPQLPQGDTPEDLQQFTKWLEGLKQK